MSYRIIAVLFTLAMLCSSCVLFPHKRSAFAIRGQVLENWTNRPLRGVVVRLYEPKRGDVLPVKTDRMGRFSLVAPPSWGFFIPLFGRGDKLRMPVVAEFSHRRYEQELVDDVYFRDPDRAVRIDFGSVYLNRKR